MDMKQVRKNINMTQGVLAKLVGVDRTTITKIENGGRPSVETAKAIASALHFERYGKDWTAFFENMDKRAI